MKNHEVIVRIIKPADQPSLPAAPILSPPSSSREDNRPQRYLHVVGLVALSVLGVVLAFNFFNFGFSLREILVIIGMPLSVGIVASYAIL